MKDRNRPSFWRNIFKNYVTQINVPFSMKSSHSVAILNLLEENGMACCTLEVQQNGKPWKGNLPDNYDTLRCGRIGLKSEMNMWMAGSDYSTGGPHRWCCRSHGVGKSEEEAKKAYLGEQKKVLDGSWD